MKILHKLENDITDYVISIEWSGSKSQVTRKLEITVEMLLMILTSNSLI